MLRWIELRVSCQVVGGCAADDATADDDDVLLSILTLVGHCGEVARGWMSGESLREDCSRSFCKVASRRLSLYENRRRGSELLANSSSQSCRCKRSNLERTVYSVLARSVASAVGLVRAVVAENLNCWSTVSSDVQRDRVSSTL